MQIFAIIGAIIKFLPLIAPVLKGIFNALNNLNEAREKDEAPEIDMEKLEEFVQERTADIIKQTISKHRGELIAYVPDEDQQARDKRINELLKDLEAAFEEDKKAAKEKEKRQAGKGDNHPGAQRPIP